MGSDGTSVRRRRARPPSAYHALVYDAIHGRTIAFGGNHSFLWERDGASWHMRTVGAGPSPTRYPAMAYHLALARRCTVLYDRSSTQTWEYDGAAWAQRVPATVPQVGTARMAYDVAEQRSLLVGESAGGFQT